MPRTLPEVEAISRGWQSGCLPCPAAWAVPENRVRSGRKASPSPPLAPPPPSRTALGCRRVPAAWSRTFRRDGSGPLLATALPPSPLLCSSPCTPASILLHPSLHPFPPRLPLASIDPSIRAPRGRSSRRVCHSLNSRAWMARIPGAETSREPRLTHLPGRTRDLHHRTGGLQGSAASEGTERLLDRNGDAGTWVAIDIRLASWGNFGIMEQIGHVITTGGSHDTGSEATASILVKGDWLPRGCRRLHALRNPGRHV